MDRYAAKCFILELWFAALLFSQGAIAQSSDPNAGVTVAGAIANIAKMSRQVDVYDLERELQLPGLPAQLVWRGPSGNLLNGHGGHHFSAVYDPAKSALGIEKIVIGWSFYVHPTVVITSLRLFLSPRACISEQSFRESMGKDGKSTFVADTDGHDGGYRVTVFEFPQYDGPVRVEYSNENTCAISITHRGEP